MNTYAHKGFSPLESLHGPPGPAPEITPPLARLLDMLTYKRPDHSAAEWEFIGKFIGRSDAEIDAAGNIWITVGEGSPIMWSCHTDTVHHEGGRQEVWLDGNRARVKAKGGKYGKSNALGADDTAGCWLLTEMIAAGVPGLYVFHRGEETGGKGSTYAAKHETHRLKGIKFAIALDRKGTGDVITHQFGSRCCSEAFAVSLAAILGGEFQPDDTGLFTDTANYTDEIGECTNLSVGYEMNHGPQEWLDLTFIGGLRETLINADWSSLVAERKPGDFEEEEWGGRWDRAGAYGGYHHDHDHGSAADLADRYTRGEDGIYRLRESKSGKGAGRLLPLADMSLVRFVRDHPDEIADMLESDGWDVYALAEYFDMDEEEIA